MSRTAKIIRPPSGHEGWLSRRQAAALLGFASEFNVRQLEKQGRLRAARGAMQSAWYARADVLAIKRALAADASESAEVAPDRTRRWTDAALIAHLREQPRTVVDLVANTGIPISRAARVYKFWLTHDTHPTAADTRRAHGLPNLLAPILESQSTPPTAAHDPSERRSVARIEHDALLRQIRDPDPKVRASAFEKLKKPRP